ncbi:hypothetical protein E8E14_000661 [Neopestalotiopsis sp. 37M]|nr:hypothetical protein E8E14_000661 [Neopestalotiopsis sp. 37M]
MRGGYLGTPIWAAIRTGQHDLAQRFCNALNLSSERRFRWLLVPAVESGDLAMVQFVERMQNATGQISERYGDVAQALKRSLELGLDEIVNHLLETLRKRKSPRGYDCFKPRLQQLYFCCTIFDDLPMFLLLIEAEKFLGFQLYDSCELDQDDIRTMTKLDRWTYEILQGIRLKSYGAVCYLVEDRKVIKLTDEAPDE